MDQTDQTGHQAGHSSRAPADARAVHSPTFSQQHLVVVNDSEEELESEQESSEPEVDQPNRVGQQAAGQSSRGPADARVVHSPTFSQTHLIVVNQSEEELVESEQESSEPAVDQPNRGGQQAAGHSSRDPADARAVHPPTSREPLPNPRQGGYGAVVARGRRTRTRSLRMNATPNEETHNF